MSQASALCDAQVAEDASSGRYLVATKELSAGHCVCDVPCAYALALHEEWRHAICAQCHTVSAEAALTIKCEACDRAYYCSDECRARHKTKGAPGGMAHDHMCVALALLGPLERQNSLVKPRLVLEILARRQLAKTDDEKRGAAELVSLSYHQAVWPEDDGNEHREAFSEWCGCLREAIRATEWGRAIESAELTDEKLHDLLSRIDVNGFESSAAVAGASSTSCGTGLYLSGATLFNHSCEPNCEVTHGMPRLTVTTSSAVAKGTPLTISYLQHYQQMDVRMRKARLWHQYSFMCACARCVVEEEKRKPRTPPRWMANCHRRGDHYVLAVGMFAASVPMPLCFLFLGVYFIFWTKVFRFPL